MTESTLDPIPELMNIDQLAQRLGITVRRRGEAQTRRDMTEISTIPQLLTIDQLAGRLGITVRHVRRLVADRRVPYVKVGRLVRFDPVAIKEWLDGARRDADPG
jgi:excisionase family DNA binding protein